MLPDEAYALFIASICADKSSAELKLEAGNAKSVNSKKNLNTTGALIPDSALDKAKRQ